MSGIHDPYGALRERDYRHVLGAGVLASLGAEVQAVAVGWELYERTGRADVLGLAGLTQFLPVLFLALPAGQAADRYSRKVLLQLAYGGMALACLGLAVLSHFQAPVPLFFVSLTLAGVSRAFSMPSRNALIPQVVPTTLLPNAVAWNSSGWQLANVVGPALGGLALAAAGQAVVAYLASALCLLVCIGLLAPVRPRQMARPAQARSLRSLLAGVRFVWRSKLLLPAITLDLFAVLLGGATALLPIYAKDILHVGPAGLGWLRAAPAMGAVLMALILAHRPPLRHAGPALLVSVVGFGLATIVFGLSRNFFLSFAMLALTGALDNVSIVVRGTLMQLLTPDEMRGRVAAVNAVFISSSNELGAFESGITAWAFGAVASVVGGGIGTILVVLLVMLGWPQLVRLGSLQSLRPAELPAEEVYPPEVSPLPCGDEALAPAALPADAALRSGSP
jgi:MFS family permease